ncbi:MAG TPA: fumarylacetoacetate hydrolase family protein [Acidobacteriaceae bacterium]|nr:fumarylacetoacetate hydrolase family protein [Acidobacteriaceae bacterium]
MKLYNTTRGLLVEQQGRFHRVDAGFDELVRGNDPRSLAEESLKSTSVAAPDANEFLAPIGSQEVWAAGVTYFRSRSARMEESRDAGGGSFYDRVYSAVRPELFFKATARRVVGPGANVRIRSDARWSVPEPELTLLLNPRGEIIGYTIGNDMSSRDIEGENPLYLPQAKVYDGSCGLGPGVLLSNEPLPKITAIQIQIMRGGRAAFEGNTTLAELKRDPKELASWLFRDSSFPDGAYLMTGTGIVPGDEFTLAHGDLIRISIDGLGTLENRVA